jgi:dolichol-phosphate mannosyltransferase
MNYVDLVPSLCVVVPVHNEAGNVLPLVKEIDAALGGRLHYEVVVVDDGSRDGTPGELAAAAARFAALRVICHRSNCGQSSAIHSGVCAARAPLVATLDGDGQNDPADVHALLDVWRRERRAGEALLVVGRRERRHDTWVRRLSSRVANRVRASLLGDATADTGSGLKLFARDAFLALPFFDHMHRFLPALFLRQGGRVISVPVRHRSRRSGRSHYGIHNRLWVGLVDLAGVMWLQRRMQLPDVAPAFDLDREIQRGH